MIRAAVIGGTNCICENLLLTPINEKYEILIVSYLSLNMLTDAAIGAENPITASLIQNKTVYILKGGLTHYKIANKALFNQYNSYLNKLILYGVKLLNCTEEIFSVKKRKKLLTNAEISASECTFYNIDNDTIITPLAQDYAREHNITIIRNDTL